MTCNIIVNEAGQVRTTHFNSTVQYDIGEINFYYSMSALSNVQMFLILKNKKGIYEIIELVRSGSQGANTLYRVPLNQTLRVNDEEVEVRVLIINNTTNIYNISNVIKMNISTNNYNLARQVFVAQQVGQSAQTALAHIITMTEENRQIYEAIKKGVKE